MTLDEIRELLPFRVNGTLEGAELAMVDIALAENPSLAAELATLVAIRSTMQAEDVPSPGEFGLARLMREVDAEGRDHPATAPAAANDNVVPLRHLRIWQAVAVVVLAVGVGFNLPSFGPGSAPMIDGGAVAVASDPTPAAEARSGFALASGGTSADFTIAFDPNATESEIRALLRQTGLEIVSGPSALGLYGVGLNDRDSVDAAFAALSESGIVEDVQ